MFLLFLLNINMKLSKIYEVIDQFDGVLLDIFGVIHDGTKLYDGVPEFMEYLKNKNKKAVFVSNAPRLGSETKKRLLNLGIKEDTFLDVITSGDVVYSKFTTGNFKNENAFFVGHEEDKAMFQGLVNFSDDPMGVNLAIFSGYKGFTGEEEKVRDQLALLAINGVYAICMNPDVHFMSQGKKGLAAGYMAQVYADMSGQIEYHGKPHKEIFNLALSKIGLSKDQVVMIGDSFETDVKGANNMGIKSIMTMTGIYGDLLSGDELSSEFEKKSNEHKAVPDFVVKNLL